MTLLRIIGKSRKPLSSYSIKKEFLKSSGDGTGQDVYRMLKILYSKRVYGIPIFSWNEIPGNIEEERGLITKLNNFFNLGFSVNETIFKKENNGTKLSLENDSSVSMFFELDSKIPACVNFVINSGGSETESMFHFNQYDNKVYMFQSDIPELNPSVEKFLKFYGPFISYLDIKLADKAKDLVKEKEKCLTDLYKKQDEILTEEIQNSRWGYRGMISESAEIKKLRSEIYEIETNSANWLYYLNTRGLLLYILGEIRSESNEKGNRKRKHLSTNRRISSTLENLSQNYCIDFPFLQYYNDFRKEYTILHKSGKVKRSNYEVELLRSIAHELQDQIEFAHIDHLQYWVTRRYQGGITFPFTSIPKIEYEYLRNPQTFITIDKIKDYISKNLNVQKEYLKNEYLQIEAKLDDVHLGRELPYYI